MIKLGRFIKMAKREKIRRNIYIWIRDISINVINVCHCTGSNCPDK